MRDEHPAGPPDALQTLFVVAYALVLGVLLGSRIRAHLLAHEQLRRDVLRQRTEIDALQRGFRTPDELFDGLRRQEKPVAKVAKPES